MARNVEIIISLWFSRVTQVATTNTPTILLGFTQATTTTNTTQAATGSQLGAKLWENFLTTTNFLQICHKTTLIYIRGIQNLNLSLTTS